MESFPYLMTKNPSKQKIIFVVIPNTKNTRVVYERRTEILIDIQSQLNHKVENLDECENQSINKKAEKSAFLFD
jgi:hypothetical protein